MNDSVADAFSILAAALFSSQRGRHGTANRAALSRTGRAAVERNRIFGEAFSKDSEFYAFYRSMTAYADAFSTPNTTLVLPPDSEFFQYFNSELPRTSTQTTTPASK